MTQKDTYNAEDIKTLDQITHVRKRIGMYLGSNSDEGVTVGLREGLDNSVDEILTGHGDRVIVRFFADNSAEVQDFARGLPVDENAKGINGIILTVGTIGSGGKFTGKTITGGLNGVGISAMNAASARFDVTVYRGGKVHQLSFKEGRAGHFAAPNDPAAKFTPGTKIKVSKDERPAAEKRRHPTGTTIRMWPDPTVFMPEARFNVEEIKSRLKATCFLIPEMTGVIEDYRAGAKAVVESYHFSGGIVDMLPTLTSEEMLVKAVHLTTHASFTEMTNVLQADETMLQQEVERPVDIDVAFTYTNGEETILNSYVNIIQTRQHGTHVDGMWRAMSRVLVNHIKSSKFLKAKETPPTMEDVREGFVGLISIKFPEPTFSAQSKDSLETQQISALVSQAVGDELKVHIDERRNQAQIKTICQRIVEAKRIRESAKLQKDTARKKSRLESRANMPAKLDDCEFPGHDYSELHIAEGDSAKGTLLAARDSQYQAILPIRGKILNVQKATLSKILGHEECAALIQVLGAGSGKTFDTEQLRYKKVFLATDADVDGAHIRSLLVTFFWKMMPALIVEGRLFASEPPLYVVKTAGKNPQTYHLQDDEAHQALLAGLAKTGTRVAQTQRLKGLGEMDAEEFELVLNPATRTVRQITVGEAEVASAMIELAMGSNVEPRKEWIMASRAKLNDEDIDL
jgi:DNA gyrase subunit B